MTSATESAAEAIADVEQRAPERRSRDLIVCASLSNLVYYKTWAAILEWKQVAPSAFLIAVLNVLALAALLWMGLRVLRSVPAPAAHIAARLAGAVLALVAAHGVTSVHLAERLRVAYAIDVAAALSVGVLAGSGRFRRGLARLLLILAPFAVVTCGQALIRAWTYDPAAWTPRLAGRLSAQPGARVVWLLFDEWDYGLTFVDRRPGLRLMELDRLARESMTASNAFPPGTTTSTSVPPMLTGKPGADAGSLKTAPTVFSRARQAGINAAVAGWFLDYCHYVGASLSGCSAFNMNLERNSMGGTFGQVAANQARNLLETQFRSPFGQALAAERHAMDYRFTLQAAVRAAVDRDLGLVFVHWPIPHEPLFYDGSRRRFDLGERPLVSMFRKDFSRYNDALELLDATVGELRRRMEAAGVWQESTVLVTSDHPYRNRPRVDGKPIDRRVPFLLKLARQKSGYSYTPAFNTVLSHDLVLAILSGRLSTADDVARWLDERRSSRVAAQ